MKQKKIKPVLLLPKVAASADLPPAPATHRLKWTYIFWVIPLSIIIAIYVLIFRGLPSPTSLGTYEIPLATKVYDRNGKLLYDIFADQNRTAVPLSKIPKHLQHATIAIEDKDFYNHQGINPVGGMLRAVTATITGRKLQGGSTITQQLVKSALLTPERTVIRKVKEIILAIWVEAIYSKDKILELYLNQVPYGGTAWGVESAAERYFGKKVEELTLAESSLLAGLPQAPTLYSPFGTHPDLAKNRQRDVLKRMVTDKYITQEQADAAAKEELVFKRDTGLKAGHFVMYVKDQLVQKLGEAVVEKGGLKVITTLDLELQEYAQATVAAEVEKIKYLRVGNGAALITKPATGEILAMIGSTDYFATPSGSYNVTTALRQPGSSIKPINYAIGIETKKVTPATIFLDIPTCFGVVNQPSYCPKNYDGKFHGPVALRMSLGNSLNIPAVKMLKINSVETMIASASGFGLDTLKDPKQYGLSLTLGGGEVHMTDMAEAFGVFANGGIRKNLVSILKVTDKNGKVIEEYKDQNLKQEVPSQLLLRGPRVLSPETAFLISHMLLDNNARMGAFGPNSELVIPKHAVSVKTGTTDDLRDNWTIGYTPQYLVATWVGNNDNSPMNPSLVSGVTGAAPIWHKLMQKMLEGKSDVWPKQPDGIVGARVCSLSGLLPPNDGDDPGCAIRFEYFIKGTVPTEREQLKKSVLIDKDTGDIVQPGKAGANVEPQEKLILKDPLSEYCLDCQHPENTRTYIK